MMNTAVCWLALLTLSPPQAVSDPVDVLRSKLLQVGEQLATAQDNETLEVRVQTSIDLALRRAESCLEKEDWLGSLRPLVRAEHQMMLAQSLAAGRARLRTMDQVDGELAEFAMVTKALEAPLLGKAQRPAALQALLEDAHARARTFASAAPRQGREANLFAGIYYLTMAKTHGATAAWLAAMECEAPAKPLGPISALPAYMDRIEAQILAKYKPPLTRSHHGEFIQISARLKFARELAAQDFELGALEEVLACTRGLASLEARLGEGPAAAKDLLVKRASQVEARLAASSADHSLAGALLTKARQLLEQPDADLEEATAILQRVLPDYFDVLEGRAVPLEAAHPRDVDQDVVITLVRWPFT